MKWDQFLTLLPLTSLRSWTEAEKGTNKSRHRMFDSTKLHQNARSKKWGLVRVEVLEGPSRSRKVNAPRQMFLQSPSPHLPICLRPRPWT